ncbi:MAG: sulfatase [Planctomycetota bacterium]
MHPSLRTAGPVSAIALALVACGGPDAERPDAARRPNVVLVVVDTLRRDHLSAYDYERDTSPALRALAEESVRYDAAVAQAPWTTPSIASLLTSRYPRALGIRGEKTALSDGEVMLAEALQGAGYDTAAVISHSFLGSGWNFDQGFEVFDEENVQGHAAVTSQGVTDEALRQIERLAAADDPYFLFVHYFDPHAAYVEHDPFPFGGRDGYDGRIRSGMLFRELRQIEDEVDASDTDELRRLYDSEIAFTDSHLARLFDALRGTGAWDDTIVVVTADHGEEFLDHGQLGHAKSLYEELVGVPLIVKPHASAAVAPGVVTETVALLDVMPTVLALTNVPAVRGLEGEPLFPAPPEGRSLFTETARANNWAATYDGRWKLVARGRNNASLFDLESDPGEQNDVAAEHPDVVERLVATVQTWRAEQKEKARSGAAVELDAAQRQRIENLGYGGR